LLEHSEAGDLIRQAVYVCFAERDTSSAARHGQRLLTMMIIRTPTPTTAVGEDFRRPICRRLGAGLMKM
jgi:hypothetical protein